MKTKIQALERVVILREIIEKVKDNSTGMDISSDADKNDKTRKGEVVSCGEGIPLNSAGKPTIKEGDHVLYNRHQASNLTHEGEKYKLMYYQDLIAVV